MIVQLKKDLWSVKEMDNKIFDGTKYDIQGFFGRVLRLTKEEMYMKEWLGRCYTVFPAEHSWWWEDVHYGKHYFKSHQTFLSYINDTPHISEKNKFKTFEQVFKANGIDFEVLA